MPTYEYECEDHGSFELTQGMKDEHKASCPICQGKGHLLLHPAVLMGDLPSKDKRMGKTRAELFDNMAKEGLGNKEWRVSDEPEMKRQRDAGLMPQQIF